jgi:hypothetical protein
MNMTTMTSQAIEKAAQKTATQLANLMLHLQQQYDFSSTDFPPKALGEEEPAISAGKSLANMIILEITKCSMYPVDPVELLQVSTTNIRRRYAIYFPLREFRQAMKSLMCSWAMLEAHKRQFDTETTGWLVSDVDYITNLVLSPVGITDVEAFLATQGWKCPLQFAPYGGTDPNEEQLTDILCRLPEFLGVLDFADADVAEAILSLFPESLVSPALYDDPSYAGSDSIYFMDTLHEGLRDRYPSLEEAYEVKIDDGCCKSVRVAEIEGEFAPQGQYRLLAAIINFEDSPGGEVYLVIHTPYMFRSVLLVSEEIANDTGPCVVRYVYDAYAQVLSNEIGEWVDIDELESGDEDEDDF